MAIATFPSVIDSSPTWQRFKTACSITLIAALVGCLIYAIETFVLRCRHRFAESPVETITRSVGIAHFLIGWLFLATSPRIYHGLALIRIAAMTLVGLGLCWGFAQAGGDKNPLAMLAFFALFFAHEATDEAKLFRRSGETGRLTARQERYFSWLGWSVASAWITLLAGFYLARATLFPRSDIVAGAELQIAWLAAVVVSTLLAGYCVRLAQKAYGSLAECLASNLPLMRVYAGLSLVLLVGSIFGSVGLNLIILVHVMTWLVSTREDLKKNPEPATNPWLWIRRTPAGFLALHLGLAVVVLVLMALRTHVWERTGIVCDAVSRGWFPYWSILHITISFWRFK